MFYLIGLGLYDENDITLRGLQTVKKCQRIYLEAYTSILLVNKERLESLYGKEITLADREMVESNSDEILKDADTCDVAMLVVGDPMGATTHADLVLRARELNIPVRMIHNASIMNGIGASGLQLYKFGQAVSLVFFEGSYRPQSFYDRIKENVSLGLHTLVLLDIKVKEQSWENLARDRKIYEPPRYMSASLAAQQMIEVEEDRKENICLPESLAVAIGRLGSDDQVIASGTLSEIAEYDIGPPLHSVLLVGKDVHDMELDYLKMFAINKENFERIAKLYLQK
ncbi:diphthine synthase Dph5 [Schizosaccharomyces cryophilus OY26]|uniref:diphthine methyl ester synthase n=1 Tax=Schizosaccharomyces cryophilus (strain OY26 / ATCC MYA-4695 / CBS 11777 / NBRC 106824 / NRRL Y48691) TaxID=653667 RepID=S9VYC4_SCHCR|nr:diphthine synthase Dph5 [Schizosaccharomyces cryophilus OY26]EPY51259.1 diphthine synthase Dph5 [Schizosaccharomyces cryophilus OY26]